MSIPEHIFRGYDIRGIVDKELNENVVRLIARSFITMLYEHQVTEAVIGCDNRATGERFKEIFSEELLQNGVDVYDIGSALSPNVYWAQYYFKCKGCVMVTASHNPSEYNGFKLGRDFSNTFGTEEIQELLKIVKASEFKKFERKAKLTKKDIFPDYKKDVLKRFNITKKFKVVIDGANTFSGVFVPDALEDIGCKVIRQNCEPDSSFPSGTPDPTEHKIQQRLADRVVKEKADIGFSYDADGDRIGVVDEKGNLIWNDTFVALLAQDVLHSTPGAKIVYNTLCSKQTTDAIKQAGGIPVMWKTGHSFIKAKIKKEKAAFGGELSGHFFFVDDFYGHDDGIYATLRLLQLLSRTGQSLSKAISGLAQYVSSPEIKLGCPDNIKFPLIDNQIAADLKEMFPDAEYIDIDGFRADTKDEMIIIRASQNGPYITIKFEAKTKQRYEQLKKEIKAILLKYKEIDFSTGVNTDALD